MIPRHRDQQPEAQGEEEGKQQGLGHTRQSPAALGFLVTNGSIKRKSSGAPETHNIFPGARQTVSASPVFKFGRALCSDSLKISHSGPAQDAGGGRGSLRTKSVTETGKATKEPGEGSSEEGKVMVRIDTGESREVPGIA